MKSSLFPVFDGHNDMVKRLRSGETFFERNDTGHIDLVRAHEGGLAGGFCAIYTRPQGEQLTGDPGARHPNEFPPTPSLQEAQAWTNGSLAFYFQLERKSSGAVRIVRTASELNSAISDGAFAIVLHIEGAEAIDDQLAALDVYHAAGLRSIGPVWSRPNIFGHGVPFSFPGSPDQGDGLTDLGKALLRSCNELHIMFDLSHLNEKGFWDVARISNAPLVATHSNAHAITPTPRNLTDKQLDAVRDSGGMVGVNFAVQFLREDGKKEADTPIADMVRHFDYLIERVGIDHVGFGSDFDGALVPAEVGDASGLPRIIDALRVQGYDDVALRKLTHENWVRLLRVTFGA